MSGIIEWGIFLALGLVAVITAAGMLITMSMYRAGLALMASFVALAGIFVLLDGELPAAIQIMMNVGGMLIMVLFMVMLMMDPGGEMMWDMKRDMGMRGLGAFSMTMPRGKPPRAAEHPEAESAHAAHQMPAPAVAARTPTVYTCPMHPEVRAEQPGQCPKCGMGLVPVAENAAGEMGQGRQGMHDMSHGAADQPAATDMGHAAPSPHAGHAGHMRPAGDTRTAAAGQGDAPPAHDAHAAPPAQHQHSMMAAPHAHAEHSAGHEPAIPPTDHMDHAAPATDTSMDMGGMDMGGMDMGGMDMGGHGGHGDMSATGHYQMMVDMAMSTAQLPWALVLGPLAAVALIALVIVTPWPVSSAVPQGDAAAIVGELLLSRYMVGFEGAAFLIVAGIAGAVILGRREGPPLAIAPAIAPGAPPEHAQVSAAPAETYTCPMHPEVRATEPGQCPKCSMPLVPARDVASEPPAEPDATMRHHGPGGGQ